MPKLRWLRWPAEALKELVPFAATTCFLVFDVRDLQREASEATIDWQYWALISFGFFCGMVLVDFGRLLARVRQLEANRALLKVGAAKEKIGRGDWHRIRVCNASKTARARGVVVTLRRIHPDPLPMSPYPARLGIKGGLPALINPGDDLLFDFVDDLKRGVLRLWTTEFQGQEFTLEDCEYRVSITVSAENAGLEPYSFRLRQPYNRIDKGLELAGDLIFELVEEDR